MSIEGCGEAAETAVIASESEAIQNPTCGSRLLPPTRKCASADAVVAYAPRNDGVDKRATYPRAA